MQQTDFKCPIYRHDVSLPILLLNFTAQNMKLSGYSIPRTAAQVVTIARKWEGRNKDRRQGNKKVRGTETHKNKDKGRNKVRTRELHEGKD